MTSASAAASRDGDGPARRGLRWWLPWLGMVMALTVLGGVSSWLTSGAAGPTLSLVESQALELLGFAGLVIVAPAAVLAARRLPLDGPRRARNAILLALTLLACGAGISAIRAALREAWRVATGAPADMPPLQRALHFGLYATVFALLYLVGIVLVEQLAAAREAEDGWERRAAELAEAVERERLAVLRGQLQPHFLFNALNGISALMGRDAARAGEMLGELRALLSAAAGGDVVTLREEMGFVARYAALQAMRFGDRLRMEMRTDPGVADAVVPRLLVQPLVENAVKHAVQRNAGPTHVAVRAWGEGDRLRLVVEDDGPPAPAERRGSRVGIGLANTRDRLRRAYGDGAEMDAGPRPEGGFRVSLSLPLAAPGETGGGA